MANVLGELFSDIAASIRDGLGYQGTMKPAQFPGKIDEIVALLSEDIESRPPMDGVVSGSSLKIERGYIKPESDRTRVTVEHGLGVMPDLIVVYQAGNPIADYDSVEEFVEAYPIISAWGMKSTFNTQIRSVMNLPGWGFTYAYGIDNVPAEERPAGFIYCPDEDTFQVGRQATDGAVGLAANLDYYWIAISGIGSGAAEPVVQALNVTENGTYTPPEGVDGYSPVTVNVDPTKVTVLAEQEITGFALDADFGYAVTDTAPTYTLEVGEKYYVTWDDQTWETTAMAADSFMPGAVFIGDGTLLELPGNGEPFAIGYLNGMIVYTAFTDPGESHRVGIKKDAVKLQDKTITENGEYTADEGFAGLGKVLVNVMQNAGSGEPLVKIFSFKPASSTKGVRVDLDIGFAPDVLFVAIQSHKTDKTYAGLLYYGISGALAEKIGTTPFSRMYDHSSSTVYTSNYSNDIRCEYDVNVPISAADATGFNLGRYAPSNQYFWCIAIGGLS